nr:hypothetical protein [Pseudomonas aeruginosa]
MAAAVQFGAGLAAQVQRSVDDEVAGVAARRQAPAAIAVGPQRQAVDRLRAGRGEAEQEQGEERPRPAPGQRPR